MNKLKTGMLLAALLALGACGRTAPDDASSNSGTARPDALHVYIWSDYLADSTIAGFERATGIHVVVEEYDSNETLETRLLTGRLNHDVVFPSARPFAQRQIAAGMHARLDFSKLPHRTNIDPAQLSALVDVDPENAHALPYLWGTTGLGINVDKVHEALGDRVPLDSWSLLFDPDNARKLAQCGISVLDDEQQAIAAALIWLGEDPNTPDLALIERARAAYADIHPHVRQFDSSKYVNQLADGTLCMAMGYSGDVHQARKRAIRARNGINVSYVLPEEGALRWTDLMLIPRSAHDQDYAHQFIDYLMRPEVIAEISNQTGYANPNTEATRLLDPGIANNPGIYPHAEMEKRLVDPVSLPESVQRERRRIWTQIKSGPRPPST